MKLVIVDYGMGNLRSVEKGLEKLGTSPVISSRPDDINDADGIIVPGVGAFGDAMGELRRLGLVETLRHRAETGVPLLGICLGLQILFERSEEAPGVEGLSLVRGDVRRFSLPAEFKIPHMGWNALEITPSSLLFAGIPNGSHVYFVHSYFVDPEEKSVVVATSEYGIRFAAAIERDNLFGVQFHPEKSQTVGLQILRNFVEILHQKKASGSPH
ncbi:MAG: imidazole glycerol phosphate synthase subunit HisH [Candidatus Sumerlaeaceae bacterium]|nr:imidazole glycerol phosphate synthase subunit HisH [Candidatus Sumerlaeaceae bacterium]